MKMKSEIEDFLDKLDFPQLTSTITEGEITETEVQEAIGKLKLGKAPGSNGITAGFYKKFSSGITPILAKVKNAAFESGELSPIQKLAIVILLFKKGRKEDAVNYLLISLMNLDYKILAYILTARIQDCLPELIHPSQSAYMPKQFLGTNIRKIQYTIDWADTHGKGWVVLVLDFRRAFDSISHVFL